MNIQPKSQQPISDDQELAKVLAGITAGADGAVTADLAEDFAASQPVSPLTAADDSTTGPAVDDSMAEPVIEEPVVDIPVAMPVPTPIVATTDGNLETIKHDALNELRPLVDKLNLSAEEKFDTYLLIIRSTDDSSLLNSAFEAARAITDETTKAQALLDIVKEIEYLSSPQKQAV